MATLNVAILASLNGTQSLERASSLKKSLEGEKLVVTIVAEKLADGVDKTYSASKSLSPALASPWDLVAE